MAVMFRSRRMTTGVRSSTLRNQAGQLVGGAEQERAVDAEDGDVIGDVLVLQHVRAAALDVLPRHP